MYLFKDLVLLMCILDSNVDAVLASILLLYITASKLKKGEHWIK